MVDAHALLDDHPVGTLLIDAGGVIRLANARARTLLEDAAMVGRPLAEVLGPLPALLERQRAVEDEELRPILTLPPDRGGRSFGFRVEPSRALPGKPAYLVVFQDITRLEAVREERNRLLQLASISEVMPAVLHELKNPLAGIATTLELQIEDSRDPKGQEQLHALLSEVRRLCLTLDGLGRFRHEVRSHRHWAIDAQLREAFSLLEPQARARRVSATCAVRDMPLLPFEPAAVRAVLFNLFTNAVHACGEGDRINIEASFDREAQVLRLRVGDTGHGMTPEVRSRCTDLFFTTKAKGSGIGLALCAGVAEAADGRLEIESAPGRGTTVTLTLPVARKG